MLRRKRFFTGRGSRFALIIAIATALIACEHQTPPTDATWDQALWDAPAATWK